MTREEHYNSLCDKADKLLSEYNPCEIKDGVCKRGYFCCDGCEHLIDNKCSIKSLLCKVWLCECARNSVNKELISELEKIYLEGKLHNMIVFRGSIDSIISKEAMVSMPWDEICKIPR